MERVTIIVWSRKNLYILAAVLVLCCVALVQFTKHAIFTTAPISDAVCGRVVVIDAGHGGRDPGAVGKNGAVEKDITLDIAQELGRLLNRVAVYTVLTRSEDADLGGGADNHGVLRGSRKLKDLNERLRIINSSDADILVSIHANSFPQSIWSGAQTFYSKNRRRNFEESRALAIKIQESLVKRLGPNTRKAKSADYYILNESSIPSALVEVGFLSNPREEKLLMDPSYRKEVAKAIFQGIIDYLVWRHSERDGGRAVISDEFVEDHAGEDHAPVSATSGGGSGQAADNVHTVLIYLGGPTNFEDCLVPEVRNISFASDRGSGGGKVSPSAMADRVLRELLKGPGPDSILEPVIPQGASLIGCRVENMTAYVDFSQELSGNHWGGSRTEELTVYSIVNTLTGLEGIEQVKIGIKVNGEAEESIAGHVVIDRPLRFNPEIIHSQK